MIYEYALSSTKLNEDHRKECTRTFQTRGVIDGVTGKLGAGVFVYLIC